MKSPDQIRFLSLKYFAAFCSDFTIPHSVSVSPSSASNTGTPYSVVCEDYYSLSSGSGFLECDAVGSWLNKPTCDGLYYVNL